MRFWTQQKFSSVFVFWIPRKVRGRPTFFSKFSLKPHQATLPNSIIWNLVIHFRHKKGLKIVILHWKLHLQNIRSRPSFKTIFENSDPCHGIFGYNVSKWCRKIATVAIDPITRRATLTYIDIYQLNSRFSADKFVIGYGGQRYTWVALCSFRFMNSTSSCVTSCACARVCTQRNIYYACFHLAMLPK